MKNLGKNPTHIRNYDEHVIYKKIWWKTYKKLITNLCKTYDSNLAVLSQSYVSLMNYKSFLCKHKRDKFN